MTIYLLKIGYRDITLSIVIFLIGLGSFLWHTFPNRITGFVDIFFIVLFMFIYTYKIYSYKISVSKLSSYIIAGMFILSSYFIGQLLSKTVISSSGFYIVIILHLILLCLIFKRKGIEIKILNSLLKATFLFILSLFLRTIDNIICLSFELGTHFLWHILNALVLFYLLNFYKLLPTEPPQKNQPRPKKNKVLP